MQSLKTRIPHVILVFIICYVGLYWLFTLSDRITLDKRVDWGAIIELIFSAFFTAYGLVTFIKDVKNYLKNK